MLFTKMAKRVKLRESPPLCETGLFYLICDNVVSPEADLLRAAVAVLTEADSWMRDI